MLYNYVSYVVIKSQSWTKNEVFGCQVWVGHCDRLVKNKVTSLYHRNYSSPAYIFYGTCDK